MISYAGLFVVCSLFGNCYSTQPKPYPNMQACLNEAKFTRLGVCRKYKGKRFIGYISTSPTYGNSYYGDYK